MSRVIVSAGHTQDEPGAVNKDLKEVALTHAIASRIVSKLRSSGIITLSVPPELDILERIDWINARGYKEESGDVCIEIHINDGRKSGIEGWFKDKGENESHKLTSAIVEGACKVTGLTNQGVKSEYDHPLKSLNFLRNINCIGSLLECLYIDSPKDQEFLRDSTKLDLLATGMANGILNFLSGGSTDTTVARPITSSSRMKKVVPQPFVPQMPPTSAFSPYSPAQLYPSDFGGMGAPLGVQSGGRSREDRKRLIQDLYKKLLGREVNPQDLSYFLNLGLGEEQMAKRIIDSQEHADIVRNSQEFVKIKPEYDKLKLEGIRLGAELKDKESLITQQNQLISQKNDTILKLQQPLRSKDGRDDIRPSSLPVISSASIIPPKKEGFVTRILRRLNDMFD